LWPAQQTGPDFRKYPARLQRCELTFKLLIAPLRRLSAFTLLAKPPRRHIGRILPCRCRLFGLRLYWRFRFFLFDLLLNLFGRLVATRPVDHIVEQSTVVCRGERPVIAHIAHLLVVSRTIASECEARAIEAGNRRDDLRLVTCLGSYREPYEAVARSRRSSARSFAP
jgi:hypothetical protein